MENKYSPKKILRPIQKIDNPLPHKNDSSHMHFTPLFTVKHGEFGIKKQPLSYKTWRTYKTLEITYLFITIYYSLTRYLQGPTEYTNTMAYFENIFHYPWAFNHLSFLIH